MSKISIYVENEDLVRFKRLDAFLSYKLQDYSRTMIKKLFEDNHFDSNQKIELKKMPPVGTLISFEPPLIKDTNIQAQNIDLDILYEDEYMVVINKQAGLVVHPAPGNPDKTLVNAILYHCPNLEGVGNEKRPGIVHRLDKGTTGVMVIAKTQKTHEGLVELFSRHDIDRKYDAIAFGNRIPPNKKVETFISRNQNNRLKMTSHTSKGKKAITYIKALEFFKNFALLEMTLETGRTHQIRVHLSEVLNSPILNDTTYGLHKQENKYLPSKIKSLIKEYDHPFLHAKTLGFIHPITKKKMFFEAPAPKLFQDILDILRNEN